MGGGGTTDCGTLLNIRNDMRRNDEDTSDIDKQLQACSLSRGTWNIDANGAQGALVISSLDTSGNVTGSILGDNFTGRWNPASKMLTFDRPLRGLSLVQHYTGAYLPYIDPTTRVFEFTLAGLFTEDTIQGSFGWFAQTRNIPDSLAPGPILPPPKGAEQIQEQ